MNTRSRWLQGFCITLLLLLSSSSVQAEENHALTFDGENDYVTVADPIQVTTGPFSIEAWIYADRHDSGGRIVSNRSAANGYELDIYGPTAPEVELRLAFNGGLRGHASFVGHLQQWTHVAATWTGQTGGTVKLYINGVEGYSDTSPSEIQSSAGPFRIGSMGTGNAPFDGTIDEVRVWSVALEQSVIQAWKDRPLSDSHPNYADLEGYWDFNEGSGQVVASAVHSPGRDGMLGSSAGADTEDPAWEENGAPVPVDVLTLGLLKALFSIR